MLIKCNEFKNLQRLNITIFKEGCRQDVAAVKESTKLVSDELIL